MSIMIDKKWKTIDDFEMMIFNDEICYKKSTTSIILKKKIRKYCFIMSLTFSI